MPRTSARSAASFPSLTGNDDPLGALGGKGKGKARQTSLDRLRGGKGGGAGGKKRQKGGAYFDASGELHDDGEEDDERDTAALLRQSQPQRDSHAIDIPSLPPRWVDVSDEVDGILNELQPKITQLDRLHAKNLLPGFVDRTKEEREIEVLGSEITKVSRRRDEVVDVANSRHKVAHSHFRLNVSLSHLIGVPPVLKAHCFSGSLYSNTDTFWESVHS